MRTVFCARNERENYEDSGWNSLPTHVPSVVFHTRVKEGDEYEWQDVSTWDLFAGRRVVLFSLPGAFTPTCSTYQLPDFERLAEDFYKEGCDAIYCVSVNDSFVMNRWAKDNNLEGTWLFEEKKRKGIIETTDNDDSKPLSFDTSVGGGVTLDLSLIHI